MCLSAPSALYIRLSVIWPTRQSVTFFLFMSCLFPLLSPELPCLLSNLFLFGQRGISQKRICFQLMFYPAAAAGPRSNLPPLPLTDDFLSFVSNCLSFCVVCLRVCVCLCDCVCTCVCSSFRATGVGRNVRLCVTSLHVYSQRSKWTRYFPPLGVDIGLSAGNSAFSPLVHSFELFKQEASGRKSGSHSFVNKAGGVALPDNCLEFPFYLSHLECSVPYSLCYMWLLLFGVPVYLSWIQLEPH